MGALAYTSDREPQHLNRMATDEANLRHALDELQRVAQGTPQQSIVAHVGEPATRFRDQADEPVRQADGLAALTQQTEQRTMGRLVVAPTGRLGRVRRRCWTTSSSRPLPKPVERSGPA